MNDPKRITSKDQLKLSQPVLVGTVTSGDHPVCWDVYPSYRDWMYDLSIEEAALDDMLDFYVYELPYSYSYHTKGPHNH